MFNRIGALSTSSLLLVLAAGWHATTSAQPNAAPRPLGAAEIREMFEELSNWGRWGENDQRGTLNLVTPAKRRQAVAFKTFLRTLVHEICHHLDYVLLRLGESFHTDGFFKRESSLVRQIVEGLPGAAEGRRDEAPSRGANGDSALAGLVSEQGGR